MRKESKYNIKSSLQIIREEKKKSKGTIKNYENNQKIILFVDVDNSAENCSLNPPRNENGLFLDFWQCKWCHVQVLSEYRLSQEGQLFS